MTIDLVPSLLSTGQSFKNVMATDSANAGPMAKRLYLPGVLLKSMATPAFSIEMTAYWCL